MSPLSTLGTSTNSYSEHNLPINANNTSADSITSLLSDDVGLGLDNNTLDKTSVTGDDVEDHANGDEEDPNECDSCIHWCSSEKYCTNEWHAHSQSSITPSDGKAQTAHEQHNDTYLGLGSQISIPSQSWLQFDTILYKRNTILK